MALLYLYAGVSLAGTIQLPQTGQTRCYDKDGAEISCTDSGQDGEIRAGISWPNPRFTVSGDCVTDNLTGLRWAKNAVLGGSLTWQNALNYVASLNSGSGLCGYRDWHLPNRNEFRSLIDYSRETPALPSSHPFINVRDCYWSSTSYENSPADAWRIRLGSFFQEDTINKGAEYFVWPVRSPTLASPAPVAKTGQTSCYNSLGTSIACAGSGQDGEIRAGVAWPDPRFTIAGDCVVDNLTGLMWAKDAHRVSATWQWALIHVALLNLSGLCGNNSWRLPNAIELGSLTHSGQSDFESWLTAQGFDNVTSYGYWSSTSYTHNPFYAYHLNMVFGELTYLDGEKNNPHTAVWPVTFAPAAPSVVTRAATNVTTGSATLNGILNPKGSLTTFYFQWGTTASYGNTTSSQSAGNGTGNVAVSANLNGLTYNMTYHYRLVATNSLGTSYGSDMTFASLIPLPWLMLLLGD